jgi:hypothetical protein
MIVSHGIDSSMVHRRQCSFWESSRFDCSEAACRIRPFGVDGSLSALRVYPDESWIPTLRASSSIGIGVLP